jgi:geranylgeranyl reductase family protein
MNGGIASVCGVGASNKNCFTYATAMNVREKQPDYDVIVVGGGPAGCAFVRSLINLGSNLRVLLIEKERFPRDKVCGDGLTYQAIPLIGEIFPELKSLTPSAAFTERQILLYPHGRLMREGQTLDVIRRMEFDNALWKATVSSGADTLENAAITGLLKQDGKVRGVTLRDENGVRDLTCRLLVGADGSRSVVRRATGSTKDDYVIHALRQYVRGIPDSTEGLIFFFDLEYQGYFWIFPFVRDGERWANAGYGNGTDNRILKERFAYYCQQPVVQAYLGGGRFEGPLTGFPLNMAKFRWNGRLTRRLWGPGYLLLGDAAALIHPFTGEGISFAIESGRIAAEVLVDDQIPPDRKGRVYERRVLRRVRPSFLSLTAFCAVRLPALLPRPLSKALIASAAFAQKRLSLGVRPWKRRSPKRDRTGIRMESLLLLALLTALGAFWLGHVLARSALPAAYGARASLFAGIATAFCLLDARRKFNWSFAIVFFLVAFISSLAIELVGGVTGTVFGSYRHESTMPGRLFGLVPLVVPFGWYIIAYLSFATAATVLPKDSARLVRTITATALFVAYDLVADPNHLYRGSWSYPGGGAYYGIPFQNFVAWVVIGFLILSILGLIQPQRERATEAKELPLAFIAYVAVMFHEGLFAIFISRHRGAGMIGFAATFIVAASFFAMQMGRSVRPDYK